MIRLDAISKRYPNGQLAVRELSLDIPDGEICVLVGTVGLRQDHDAEDDQPADRADVGRIFLDGDDVTHADPVELRRRIGYVIQQVGLFPHQTIATNIATVPTPARLAEGPRHRARRRAARPGGARPGRLPRRGTPRSSRAGSASASASRARWPPTRPCC